MSQTGERRRRPWKEDFQDCVSKPGPRRLSEFLNLTSDGVSESTAHIERPTGFACCYLFSLLPRVWEAPPDVGPHARHPGNSSIPGRTRRPVCGRAICLELHSWARRAEHFSGAPSRAAASCRSPADSSPHGALCDDRRLGFLLPDPRRGGQGFTEQDTSSTENAPRQLPIARWYGARTIR